jgi:hypothetical protein
VLDKDVAEAGPHIRKVCSDGFGYLGCYQVAAPPEWTECELFLFDHHSRSVTFLRALLVVVRFSKRRIREHNANYAFFYECCGAFRAGGNAELEDYFWAKRS